MSKNKNTTKDKEYNKKRKPIFRVEATTADSESATDEMFQMKDDLLDHSGSAKYGVINMYRFAKENGFFDQTKKTK